MVDTHIDRHGRSAETRHGDLPPLQPPDQSLYRTGLAPPMSKHHGQAERVRAIRGLPASGGRWWCRRPAGLSSSNPSTRPSRQPAHHNYFRTCTAPNRLPHILPSCPTSRERTRARDPAGRKFSRNPLSRRVNTRPQQLLIKANTLPQRRRAQQSLHTYSHNHYPVCPSSFATPLTSMTQTCR